MAVFKKNRRPVVAFVPPEPEPLAPIDDVIDDALKIAYYGVRMAVKNHLIVNAVRDGKPFDEHELEEYARSEYEALADSSREGAVRAQNELDAASAVPSGRIYPGGKPVVIEPDHQRKPEVLRAVADAYVTTAVEPEALGRLVDEAKAEAWNEIGGTLTERLTAPRPEDDPDYHAFRQERIAHFVEEDLAALLEHQPSGE